MDWFAGHNVFNHGEPSRVMSHGQNRTIYKIVIHNEVQSGSRKIQTLLGSCRWPPFFGFFEILFIRGEFKYTPDKAEELLNILGDIANKLGINAESRGDTPTKRKYKHSKKQKEGHVLVLNAIKGKLLRLQNRNDEALTHYNRIIPLKPSGKIEKNIYWEWYDPVYCHNFNDFIG